MAHDTSADLGVAWSRDSEVPGPGVKPIDISSRVVTLDRMDPDDDDDYFSGEYLQDILEFRLAELGGEALVQAAQVAAAAHVVNTCPPWDGTGDEPDELVSGFCAGLWLALEHHRTRGEGRVRADGITRSRSRRLD